METQEMRAAFEDNKKSLSEMTETYREIVREKQELEDRVTELDKMHHGAQELTASLEAKLRETLHGKELLEAKLK